MTKLIQLQPLHIAQLPLQGIRLIEASAGTGKTYTIAMLYLRLVLGHGLPQRYLSPEILVLTFTDAAASELRDRIRLRLTEAAQVFRGQRPADPALQDIMQAYPAEDHEQQAFVLEQAAEWLDEAAISTIHAWCLRVLQQHAFDSGSLFSLRLVKDLRDRRDEVVRDVWREWFYPLSAVDAARMTRLLGSPDTLARDLDRLVSANSVRVCFAGLPARQRWSEVLQQLGQQQAVMDAAWQQVYSLWQQCGDEVRDLLEQASSTGQLSKTKYSKPICQSLYDALNNADAATPPAAQVLVKMTPSALSGATNKGKQTPEHAFFDRVEQWLSHVPAIKEQEQQLLLALLTDLQQAVTQRLALLMRTNGELSFDDLLTQLDNALTGPDADALAQRLRQRFPMALIDEFQDTDPLQFRLFSRLYDRRRWSLAEQQQAPACALLMIGDPKQAIYSFRGADLPTYLQARQYADQPCYTLTTNYRSDQALVEAVNALFSWGDSFPQGVFRQGNDANGLPFQPVQAARQQSPLQQQGADGWQPVRPLHLVISSDDETLSKGKAQTYLAQVCAEQISQWLSQGAAGQLCLFETETVRGIAPGDIAVLVRTRHEARDIRVALQARGISSVFGSNRDSVYASQEAVQLQLWLEALVNPWDETRLRLALATPLLGYEWSRLAQLRVDEQAWEVELERAQQCHACWQQEGVLSAIRRWLFAYQVPARLLSDQYADGERALTNLLHLAELLQTASVDLQGEHALIRYLAEHRAAADRGASDEAMLRLESDSERVRIVTLHQSKGLEYPLVCLPFTCLPSGVKPKSWRHYHDAQGLAVIDLDNGSATTATALAAAEQLQEDMRLFYVGLTRARHLLWTAVLPVTKGTGKALLGDTPWAVLLTGENELTDIAVLGQKLSDLCQHLAPYSQFEAVSFIQEPACSPVQLATPTVDLLPARRFAGLPDQPWWISSYSALGQTESAVTSTVVVPDDARMANFDEELRSALSDLPRGAETGTFWHEILEFAADYHFGRSADDLHQIEAELEKRCLQRGWQEHYDTLKQALPDWLRQSFSLPQGNQLALSNLQEYYVELEFWLASDQVSVADLDALIGRYCVPNEPRPALTPMRLNGLFKGFIDLVFAHQGRYYILDYKSNYLGDQALDYAPERIRQDMLKHRYDVQYALYLLALHRLLKVRLADYDYDLHIGGAVYLYLRGRGHEQMGEFAECPPRQLVEALDALFANKALATGAVR